jgi:hypothetical protein
MKIFTRFMQTSGARASRATRAGFIPSLKEPPSSRYASGGSGVCGVHSLPIKNPLQDQDLLARRAAG